MKILLNLLKWIFLYINFVVEYSINLYLPLTFLRPFHFHHFHLYVEYMCASICNVLNVKQC